MASKGNIKEFNINTDNWPTYVARVRAYFKINDIKPLDETTYFIALAGNEWYDLIANLSAPKTPDELAFSDIVNLVSKHLKPQASEIAERMRFRACKQATSESLNDYILRLRTLAKTCNFKSADNIEENLRDQMVYGMRSDSGRQRLLTEQSLTFKSAVEIALSLESAENEVRGETSAHVMAMTARGRSRQRRPQGAAWVARRGASDVGTGGRGRSGPRARAPSGSGAGGSASRCSCCGSSAHHESDCAFSQAVCFKCNKIGHISHVCKYYGQRVHYMGESDSESSNSGLYQVITTGGDGPWYCDVQVEETKLRMQLDTGSSISAISEKVFIEHFSHLNLEPSTLQITVYSGHKLSPLGEIHVKVCYNDQIYDGTLYVMPSNDSPCIMGRKWIRKLGIEVPYIAHVSNESAPDHMQEFVEAYPSVFSPGMGRYNRGALRLEVEPGSVPVWRRARTVPHALRERVDAEIDRLLAEGVLSPVEVSEWGTPIVVAFKKSGDIRLCGDFKATLNPVLRDDKHPLPLIQDIFSSLQGGKLFSKIDLKNAYLQVELDDESRKLCTITTSRGNYCFNRLPFGIKCAPNKFQRIMDQLFTMKHVTVFLDDLLVSGATKEEHRANLHKVFKILSETGLKVAKEKCSLFQKSISYLGHSIDADGLHTEQVKVDAMFNTEPPRDRSELKSFLGLINYYGKFLANLSTVLSPLYDLLNKKTKYVRSTECESAFVKVKQLMVSADVLAHFDPALPVEVACDASPTGVAAVLSQRGARGLCAVQHASRRLSPAERNYSQLCREGLAIVFALKRFHDYIYGRHFTLVTDCKPLAAIFGTKTAIPQMMAGRLQRWALLLSAYHYDIRCIKSDENCLADCLSRHPTPSTAERPSSFTEDYYLNFIEADLPVTFKEVALETAKEDNLFKVMSYLIKGWPGVCDKDLLYYFQRRDLLNVDRGCLFYGYRIIIPLSLRNQVLKQLHCSHLGMVKTKSLARAYVCWPGMDRDIEQLCRSCAACLQQRSNPQAISELQSWPWPEKPWTRLHLDFLGKIDDKYYLILVDSHSKWLEVKPVISTSAVGTIKVLREIFATFGLPDVVVSDNGPPFQSKEFHSFLKKNGIHQITSPPYHPRSNGAAENAVAQVKKCIKKALGNGTPLDVAISRFLLTHRNTPSTTTGKAPSELLMGRTVKTCWDLLIPQTKRVVLASQESQRKYHGGHSRQFGVGDTVAYRQYSRNKSYWAKGKILNKLGPLVYEVGNNNEKHKRHVDQIIQACEDIGEEKLDESSVPAGNAAAEAEVPAADCASAPASPLVVAPPAPPTPPGPPDQHTEKTVHQ